MKTILPILKSSKIAKKKKQKYFKTYQNEDPGPPCSSTDPIHVLNGSGKQSRKSACKLRGNFKFQRYFTKDLYNAPKLPRKIEQF